jgi:hypothetical protein
MMADFALSLYENPAISTTRWLANVTEYFGKSWRHGIAERGGCWMADGTMINTSPQEMERFFMSHLGRRLVASAGGKKYWDGLIVRMELAKQGQTFVRSIEDQANRTKVIYRKIGPQLLANGDVEGGAWAQQGTPSTIETTTDWWSKGTTAMHCITDAANEGMIIEAAVGITAGVAYTCSVVVKVVSGTWTLRILDAGTADVITERSTDGTAGRTWLQVQMPDSHAFASVDIHLIADDAAREIYADGAILRTSPQRCETEWVEDTASTSAHGRMEGLFLEGEMTDDEADGHIQRELTERAWPRTAGAEQGGTLAGGMLTSDNPTQLTVTCQGMVWTLTWRHTLQDGTDQADNHVTNIIDESEFIASANAIIDTNAAEVLVESTNPITLWEAVEKVTDTGDGVGGVWTAGVYPDYEFRFEARDTTRRYEFRDGELRYFGGGAVHPIEAVPGWIWMADMPAEPTPAGASDFDDPRWQLATEMWFISEPEGQRLEWVLEQ